MQGQSHASQNMGEPLNSPDADSQEAIRSPNGRTRTVGRFEDATLMWSFEAHIETLKQQLSRVEARAEKQAAEFAERAAQVAAEHTAHIKALEGHIETLKAREGPTERVESQAAELAALIHTLKEQLSIGRGPRRKASPRVWRAGGSGRRRTRGADKNARRAHRDPQGAAKRRRDPIGRAGNRTRRQHCC